MNSFKKVPSLLGRRSYITRKFWPEPKKNSWTGYIAGTVLTVITAKVVYDKLNKDKLSKKQMMNPAPRPEDLQTGLAGAESVNVSAETQQAVMKTFDDYWSTE